MQPTLLAQYVRAPGHCFACRAAQRDNERIVDLGVEVESPVQADPNSPTFSVQYLSEPLVLCEACINEIARMVGMVPEADFVAVSRQLVSWRAMADQEAQRSKDLHDAVAALERVGYIATPVPPIDEAERVALVNAQVFGDADEGIERFECPECPEAFWLSRSRRDQHIDEAHNAPAPLLAMDDAPRCEACDRTFKNELGLAQHIGKRHAKETV